MTLPALKFGERADCESCGGSGEAVSFTGHMQAATKREPCEDCKGTGKELTREDHLLLSAEPTESDLDEVKDEAEEIEAYWTAREKRLS